MSSLANRIVRHPSPMTRPVHTCECRKHVWACLTKGYVTFVSPCDSAILALGWYASKTSKTRRGRSRVAASRGRGTNRVYLHQMIRGRWVDHRNQNSLDNTRHNLRPTTPVLNGGNRRYQKHSSRFKGVSFDKRRNKFQASIRYNGVLQFLGYFLTEEPAARTYDVAAKKLFGQFASTNAALGLYEIGKALA